MRTLICVFKLISLLSLFSICFPWYHKSYFTESLKTLFIAASVINNPFFLAWLQKHPQIFCPRGTFPTSSNSGCPSRLRTRCCKYPRWFHVICISTPSSRATLRTVLWEAAFPVVHHNFSWKMGGVGNSKLVHSNSCLAEQVPVSAAPQDPGQPRVFPSTDVVSCVTLILCCCFSDT